MTSPQDLMSFETDLVGANSANATEFKRLLERGIELLALTDKEIAREFGASLATVARWRTGAGAPHRAMRRPVFEWLRARVRDLTAKDQQHFRRVT